MRALLATIFDRWRPRPRWERYSVHVDADAFVVQGPGTPEQRVAIDALNAIYVETNDTGPVGLDVWFVLQHEANETSFPLGAIGDKAVLEAFHDLPGFEMKGMNSTQNARFLCWSRSPAR